MNSIQKCGVIKALRTQAPLSALVLLFAAVIGYPVSAQTAAEEPTKTFKVCRDPNNLPFSNSSNEGYEDKIAQVLADSAGRKLEFYDFASRFNFIRNTLKFKLPGEDYRCDVVIGVPAGFDQVSATKPYFRSTYALVIPQGRGLDAVKTVDDFLALPKSKLNKLHIGVIDRSPASNWLVNHGLLEQGIPYRLLVADLDQTAGGIIENDLVGGKIDVAVIWGPIAGYYARRNPETHFTVIPMKSENGVKFEFDIAMGVRYGEKEWKQQVEQLIETNKPKILSILADYGVPAFDVPAATEKDK